MTTVAQSKVAVPVTEVAKTKTPEPVVTVVAAPKSKTVNPVSVTTAVPAVVTVVASAEVATSVTNKTPGSKTPVPPATATRTKIITTNPAVANSTNIHGSYL